MTETLKNVPFISRQRKLLHSISYLIHTLKAPDLGDNHIPFTGIRMFTGHTLHEMSPTGKRSRNTVHEKDSKRKHSKMMKAQGGGKKKYEKSPRRRTMRKTRRHK